MPWVYILRCGDNTFYVGHTDDVDARLAWHRAGLASAYTSARLPVDLVYSEEHASLEAAIKREGQLKRWSAEKKAALVERNVELLKRLSRRRHPKGSPKQRQPKTNNARA